MKVIVYLIVSILFIKACYTTVKAITTDSTYELNKFVSTCEGGVLGWEKIYATAM